MILTVEHRADAEPIAPQLLLPEPRLPKCSALIRLRRLGVFVPPLPRSQKSPRSSP